METTDNTLYGHVKQIRNSQGVMEKEYNRLDSASTKLDRDRWVSFVGIRRID